MYQLLCPWFSNRYVLSCFISPWKESYMVQLVAQLLAQDMSIGGTLETIPCTRCTRQLCWHWIVFLIRVAMSYRVRNFFYREGHIPQLIFSFTCCFHVTSKLKTEWKNIPACFHLFLCDKDQYCHTWYSTQLAQFSSNQYCGIGGENYWPCCKSCTGVFIRRVGLVKTWAVLRPLKHRSHHSLQSVREFLYLGFRHFGVFVLAESEVVYQSSTEDYRMQEDRGHLFQSLWAKYVQRYGHKIRCTVIDTL